VKNPYERRTTAHSPKIVIVRDRARLIHGEPLCGKPPAPGSTTSVDVNVDCPRCLELLRGEK
jgi:hypothetical protein